MALMAGGCTTVGNLTSIYRTPDLDSGRSVVLDAEQWAVLNHDDGDVVCAMPSPDALAAAAASGSLSVDNGAGVSGGAAGALGESAASIGLRTQSIQLLRDALYRMCEAYANEGMDGYEYGIMMRRFQSSMVAILAIEQLTGAVVAPPAAVSATGEATVMESLMRERRAIVEEISELEVRIEEEEDENEKKRLQDRLNVLKEDNEHYINAIGAVTRGDFAAAELMVGGVSNRGNGLSGNDLAAVATAVESITLAAMGTQDGFHEEMCFEMGRSVTGRQEIADGPFLDYCARLATANVAERQMFVRLIDQTTAAFLSDGALSPDELRALDQMLAQIDRHWTRGDLRSFAPTAVEPPVEN
jgi:hypothetical protein